eukprot:3993212-Amphidinium_carterae.1
MTHKTVRQNHESPSRVTVGFCRGSIDGSVENGKYAIQAAIEKRGPSVPAKKASPFVECLLILPSTSLP